jgi:hypothetical protein
MLPPSEAAQCRLLAAFPTSMMVTTLLSPVGMAVTNSRRPHDNLDRTVDISVVGATHRLCGGRVPSGTKRTARN